MALVGLDHFQFDQEGNLTSNNPPAPFTPPITGAPLGEAVTRENFLRQQVMPGFHQIHNTRENLQLPLWDIKHPLQPNVVLGGPFQNPEGIIGRVVYGVPKQFSMYQGLSPEDFWAEDLGGETLETITATTGLQAIKGTGNQTDRMRLWANCHQTGVQYVPAGLCPELNIAAKEARPWEEIKEASEAITAAGDAVMFPPELQPGYPVNEGGPVPVASREHFQQGIKRPPNSWILYRRDLHKQIVRAHPTLKNTDISQMWRHEQPHIKQNYIDYADAINESFRRNFPNYKFSPRRVGQRKRRAARDKSTLTQLQMNSVIDSLPTCNSSIIDGSPIHPAQSLALPNPLGSINAEQAQSEHIPDEALHFLGEMFRDELMQGSHSWEAEPICNFHTESCI